MAQCRDDTCLMSFNTERQRDTHESLMHKTLINRAVVRMVDEIIANNAVDKLNNKIIKTTVGNFSYNDAKKILKEDNAEQKAIIKVLESIIHIQFARNPEWTLREFFAASQFSLK